MVDPLDGIEDVYAKVLDTVDKPEITFSRDGLRLMRLARFAGELGFEPTRQVIDGATEHAHNILDISPERVYDELKTDLA
jgi:poly(A) polymerase